MATSKDRPLDNPYSINVADVCPVEWARMENRSVLQCVL